MDYCGQPVVVLRAGLTNGLPCALQLVADRCKESLLLTLAATYEQNFDPFNEWPTFSRCPLTGCSNFCTGIVYASSERVPVSVQPPSYSHIGSQYSIATATTLDRRVHIRVVLMLWLTAESGSIKVIGDKLPHILAALQRLCFISAKYG